MQTPETHLDNPEPVATSLIKRLSVRLQNHPKRVIFPEGSDLRVIQAARLFKTNSLGAPILVGDQLRIKANAANLSINLEGFRIIDPVRSQDFPAFVSRFRGLQRFRGLDDKQAADYLADPNYFAAMMVATGGADAIVSGGTTGAPSALRPILQIFQRQANVKTVSSMLIMETGKPHIGTDGVLFLSDCAVIPQPDAVQLSELACTTAMLAKHLTNQDPRVAFLSYSTKSPQGVTAPAAIALVKSATALAKIRAAEFGLDIAIDGELQADAALAPETASVKVGDRSVAGRANVLIFPDLNSANIASKMVRILGDVRAYGQILTGLEKPAAEISRGASAHDIYGTAVIAAAQAVDRRFLYPSQNAASQTPPPSAAPSWP